MRILFIASTRIGDAVLSSGVLGELAARHPDARIWVACGPLAEPVFRHAPGVERILIMKKEPRAGHWRKLLRETMFRRWDMVIDLRGSATAWLLWAKKRHVLRAEHTLHRVIHNANVVGMDPAPWPRVWPGEAARARALELIPDGRIVLALGPSAAWIGKMWPVERFTELATRLIGPGGPLEGAHLLVTGGPGEQEKCLPAHEAAPPERRIDLIGEDLNLVAACFERAALYIGNDSGLMHLAAAAGAPTLGLFGPTPDGRYDPWGRMTARVRGPRSHEEITALQKAGLMGPNGMGDLEVDKVYDAATELLARSTLENSGRKGLA